MHDDDGDVPGERDGFDGQGATVDQQRVIGCTEQRRELVHEPAGHTGRADLGVERGTRRLAPIELEARGVGECEDQYDGQRGARREPGTGGDGGGECELGRRDVGTAIREGRDRTGDEATPRRLDRAVRSSDPSAATSTTPASSSDRAATRGGLVSSRVRGRRARRQSRSMAIGRTNPSQ